MSLWASFVIETPGGRIYFVADSGYGDARQRASHPHRAARHRNDALVEGPPQAGLNLSGCTTIHID
jgi:L-ascorbate metabolism protein UlaG (beta-lactamase superfamily)